MKEPTNDDTIQQLVRAVLDAVDARLDGIRHELAAFSGDVERRHHELLHALASMERRVEALERDAGDRSSSASSVRERIEHLQVQLDLLEHEAHAAPAVRAEAPAPDLSVISKPLYTTSHVTTQLPVVTDPAIQEITSLAIPPAVPPTMTSPTRATSAARPEPPAPAPTPTAADEPPRDITEEIDLEQLTNLLNERLGHLTLPPTTDD